MNFLRLPLLWSIIFLGAAFSLRAADATATLSVMSPEGAKILIDGKDRGLGPAILRELPAGRRLTVRVEMEGRPAVERDLTLAAGRIMVFDVDAPPEQPKAEKAAAPAPKEGAPGGPARGVAGAVANTGAGGTATVSVMTQDGATVLLDGAPAGYAPVILRNLPAEKPFTIRLELAGHESLERSFTLLPGKRETFEVELQPLHPGFELTTSPGAEVVVINEQGKRVPIGFTDDKGIISSEGKVSGVSCTIEISKQGYEPIAQKVPLDPKNKTRLTITLRPKPARLQIVSVPAVSDVLVNGQKRPVARGIVEVQPDTDLIIEVKREGYAAKSQKAKVAKGEEAVLNFGNLDPLSGGVKIEVVTERGAVGPDFHSKVRAFVDSREVPWGAGRLTGLTPGKHELMLMHELYNVVGEGGATIEVKEGVITETIVKVEMRPARLRVAVQGKDQAGKLFKPAFALRIDGLPVERTADETYDVPAGREFTLSVSAMLYTTATRTFAPLSAGEEAVWEPVIEWDNAGAQVRVRARFDADMAVLVKETEDKISALRKTNERGPAVVTEARQWTAQQRLKYTELEKRSPGVFVKSTQFEQNLGSIEKLAETMSQQPKKKSEAPSPF